MSVQFPELPYDADALQPHISASTLHFHHGKHHRGYVRKLNAAIDGTRYAGLALEAIVLRASKAGDMAVFNNAAQTWNHSFLWHSMAPDGGGEPEGELARLVSGAFGNYAAFRDQFKSAATGLFGSGWVWLVTDGDALQIKTTNDAETPMTEGLRPLLTLDVWEHAYYLDFQNDRGAYVDAFLGNLANWQFAASNLATQPVAA